MGDEKISVEALQSFDLGEAGGGVQLIIDYKPLSPTEYYVMTVGNGPTGKPLQNFKKEDWEGYVKNQMLEKSKREKAGETDDIKLRFFKLTLQNGNRYSVEEFVTLEGIRKILDL